MERREVYYSGNVQGVGFRFTARYIAQRFAVSGLVENLDDGRVRLVAEGEAAVLDEFLASVAGELARHITARQVSTTAARGEFHGFAVRP